MQEDYLLRSGLWSLTGATETWIAVAYLAGMFLILAFRPQQIAEPFSFRLSYILFALYLILPSCINACIFVTMLDNSNRSGGPVAMVVFQLSAILGRVLLGVSIVFALGSMVRRGPWEYSSPRRSEPEGPA